MEFFLYLCFVFRMIDVVCRGGSVVKKEKEPMLGMMNRFAVAILGAIIMYEIEYHDFMWIFAAGIMGGYESMRDVEE